MRILNKVTFEKIDDKNYFARTLNYPNLVVIGELMDIEGCFLKTILDFLKNSSHDNMSLNEHFLIKYGDFVYIKSDVVEECYNRFDIHKDILIKIIESFLYFAKDNPDEIVLTEEGGIYTMNCNGKTVQINDNPMPVTNPIQLTEIK